jgi:hypothetical protein
MHGHAAVNVAMIKQSVGSTSTASLDRNGRTDRTTRSDRNVLYGLEHLASGYAARLSAANRLSWGQ